VIEIGDQILVVFEDRSRVTCPVEATYQVEGEDWYFLRAQPAELLTLIRRPVGAQRYCWRCRWSKAHAAERAVTIRVYPNEKG
jgi:hypothetical protein